MAGHDHIAYVSGPPAIPQVADRHEGALRAFARAGRPADDLEMIDAGALNVAGAQKAGAEIAALPRDPGPAPCSAPTT